MKRIDLEERINKSRKTTACLWFKNATDEDLAILEKDIAILSPSDFTGDVDKGIEGKYPFSKSAARDWLGLNQESNSNCDISEYHKPTTEYKKITLTFTAGTHTLLTSTVKQLADKYGYSTKYIVDYIIRAGINNVTT